MAATTKADSCRAYLYHLTEEPHVAGTDEDLATADYVLAKFKSFGLTAEIVSYDVYLSYPKEVKVEMTRPELFQGPTPEPGFPVDKDSYAASVFPAFNGYSPSGEADGQVVYVNYGRPEDYDQLDAMGVSVQGKIVLARYGRNYRGVKTKLAEEHGAAALLIYSDPADDGYMKGDVFPDGPFRPRYGVQRGSIQYMFTYPGDPLTPGYAATSTAKRITPELAKNLPGLVTIPLSYGDAEKILANLAGFYVPEGWQGGLPFAYHVGPGPAEMRLKVDMDYQIRPIWNVIARLPGSEQPEQEVVFGNHRDAWTYGAVDPSSGTAVLLEVARTYGELLKKGYRPKRTLVFASWDAEEYGLIGSTEWVEDNRATLMKNCVTYVNVDVGVAGNRFGAAASPGLKNFIQTTLQAVADPKTGRSLLEQTWLQQNEKSKAEKPAFDRIDTLALRFDDLGSGSDFTAFFDFAGVPSLSMGFGGPYGVYHAIYDDFYWMSRFGDPDFSYHATMSTLTAITLHRLADAEILPFNLANYARELRRHAARIEKALREQKAPTAVNLQSLIDKCTSWEHLANALPKIAKVSADLDPHALNDLLMGFERNFLSVPGLPSRPWYKHLLFAPSLDNGYAAVAFPSIQYQIDKKDWNQATAEIAKIAQVLEKALENTRHIRDALSTMRSGL